MAVLNPDLTGANADNLRRYLLSALSPYGWDGGDENIRVTEAREYGAEGWQNIPNEYDVAIAHPNLTGMGSTWRGTVSGGPNQTLKVREGSGHQLYIGDLHTVGEQGLSTTTGTAPYYSGVQGFGRRVAAAFGLQLADKDNQFSSGGVMDKFRQVNTVQTPTGGVYKDPTGETIPGRIPSTNVRIEPTVSPVDLLYQAHTYNVPLAKSLGGDQRAQEAAISALHAQTRTLGAGGIADPFYKLHGGGVFEPSRTSGGRYVTPAAVGTQYTDPEGRTQVAALTEKFLKQTYTAGRREIAAPGVLAGGKMSPIPENMLNRTSLNLRGEAGFSGMLVTAATSLTSLPWQSGQMQFNLPQQLKQYVTGQEGNVLALRDKTHQMPIYLDEKMNDLASLAKHMPKIDYEGMGKVMPRGGTDPVTLMKGNEKVGLPPVTYTPGQQYEQINRMNMVLPAKWGEGMTDLQTAPFLKQLQKRGFETVRFGAVDQPAIELGMTVGTMAGPKMGAAKGQLDIPLAGVDSAIRTGSGSVPYDVLQNAKQSDALMLNVLQALESQGEGKLAPFIQTLFPDKPTVAEEFATSDSMNLQDIAVGSGKYETGEHLLESITNRVVSYGNQEQLRKDFGIGMVEGRAPLMQWTPETYKQYRSQFIEAGMRRGYYDETVKNLTRSQAETEFNRQVGKYTEFDKTGGPGGKGLYTFSPPMQTLVHPKLQTFVQETGGLGSMQYEVELGLRAQGQGEVADWISKNQQRITPSSPARWAIEQASRGWSSTLQERPTSPQHFRTITPEIAGDVLRRVTALTVGQDVKNEYKGPVGGTRAYQEAFRGALGLDEGQAEPVYWFEGQKTGMFGGEAALNLESLQQQLTEEGFTTTSQSRVVERYNKSINMLLEAEASGVQDPIARQRAETLQNQYIDSEQIRKMRGGFFSRAVGSSLVPTGHTFMTEEAMKKFYLSQGGRGVGKSREWRQYLKSMQDTATVSERFPAPNVGSEGMPGSIAVNKLLTPQSETGSYIQQLLNKSGMMSSDAVISAQSVASQGDVDLDPYAFFPLSFRVGKKWKSFRPSGTGEDASKYKDWLNDVVSQQSPEQQQKTFDVIYGAGQNQFNPYSQNMVEYMNRMMGEGAPVETLLDKRLATQSDNIQGVIEDWNRSKGRDMGSLYNAFSRRTDVAASLLGMPERPAAFARDIGIGGYQTAIDMRKFASGWEGMMQTAGFHRSKQGGPVRWGFFNDGVWADGGWSPGQSTKYLASNIGGILARQTGATPDLVAALSMQIPERGEMGKDEFGLEIERRRNLIADQLRPIFDDQKNMTGAAFTDAIARTLTPMTEGADPLIGVNSIGAMTAMSRSMEFTGRDPENLANVRAGINEAGGFVTEGGRVSFDDMRNRVDPYTTMYSFARNVKGDDLSMAFYKDPVKIANALVAANQNQALESPLMRQFARTWGEISGFTPAEGGGTMITDPYSGKPVTLRSTEDIATLERSWRERVMANPYAGAEDMLQQLPLTGRTGQPTERLRASSLAYIGADFSKVDPKVPRLGHQAHKYIAQHLIASNDQALRMVEQPMTGGPAGLTGTIDELRQDPEGLTLYDWKTGTTDPKNYAGQMSAYVAGTGAERVMIGKIPRGEVEAVRRQVLTRARAERKAAGAPAKPSFDPYEPSDALKQREGQTRMLRRHAQAAEQDVQAHMAIPTDQYAEGEEAYATELDRRVDVQQTLQSKHETAVQERTRLAGDEFRASPQGEYEASLTQSVQKERSELLAAKKPVPDALEQLHSRAVQSTQAGTPLDESVRTGIESRMPMVGRNLGARKPLVSYQQEMGGILRGIGRSNLVELDKDLLKPRVLEKYITDYAESKGIEVQTGGAGGGGRLPPSVATAMAEPEGHQPGEGADELTASSIRKVLEEKFGTEEAEPKRGTRRAGGFWEAKGKGSPEQMGQRFLHTVAEFQKNMGRFTEQGALQGGRMRRIAQNMPQHLANMFPEESQRQEILKAEGFEGALATAQDIANREGFSLKKMVADSPQLRQAQQFINRFQSQVTDVNKMGADLPTQIRTGNEQELQAMIAMGGNASASGVAAAQLGPMVGPGLQTAYTRLQLLDEASKKGSQGRLPMGQVGTEIQSAWVDLMKETTGEIEKQSKQLRTYKGELKETNDVLKEGLEEDTTGKLAQRVRKYTESGLEAQQMAHEVRRRYDLPRRRGLLTPTELDTAAAKGGMEDADVSYFQRYTKKVADTEFKRFQAEQQAMGKPVSGEAPDRSGSAARLSRRMLGGFGLMYMRSIGGIMAGGLTQGYNESIAQRQAILGGMGMMGGAPPAFTPDERLAQAQAVYGGRGWAGLQNLRADATRRPGRAGAMGAGQAFVGATGLALTLGMWGAPISTPLALGLGAAAAVGQQAIATYGAYSDTEGTAQGMGTRMMAMSPAERERLFAQAEASGGQGIFRDTLGIGLSNLIRGSDVPTKTEEMIGAWFDRPGDTDYAAWAASPEGQELTQRFVDIEEREEGQTVREKIEAMGYGGISAQELEAQFWQQRSLAPDVKVGAAGFIGAAQLQERYGLEMDFPQQQFLAGAIMQQAPWVQAAQQFGAMPYRTREGQEAMAGEFIDRFNAEGGRTQEEVEVLTEGYQRLVGLGLYAPQAETDEQQEALQEQLGADFTQQGYDLMRQEYGMGAQRRQMGLFWQPPVWEEYMGEMTPEEVDLTQRDMQRKQQQTTALFGVYQGQTALGFAPEQIDMAGLEGTSIGQLQTMQSVQQMGIQLQGILPTAGWDEEGANMFGRAFSTLDPRQAKLRMSMAQGDQASWARYMIQQPQAFEQMMSQYGMLQGMGGSTIDMGMMGMVDTQMTPDGPMMTGLPWGSTSLATPFQSSQQMATRIFGDGAGMSGGLIGALTQGGTFGGQVWQQQQQAAHAGAMAGLQLEQLQLTKSFQTGVGLQQYSGTVNPQTGQPFGFHQGRFNVNVGGVGGFRTEGGGLWGVQDAMRGLGWMQQEWGFDRQKEQLGMQDRQWQQNWNLNRRGAMMQRPWQREDWAYQDTTRGLQWQWQQEDFQEESRFMTGRDRRVAERGMARQTIMHDLEGEQIDKQRNRQEKLWDLEDERFSLQEAQHNEQIEFQKEGIRTQEKFFEERKRLEQEQILLTRAYYTEQMKLQEEQIKASAAYAATQAEIAATMLQFRQESAKLMAQGGLFNEDTWAGLMSIFSEIDPALAEAWWDEMLAGMKDLMNEAGKGHPDHQDDDDDGPPEPPKDDRYDDDDDTSPHPDYRQHGGRAIAGHDYVVGEAGTETFQPYFTGDVLPSYKTNPFETTMISGSDTPTKREQQLIQLILNLGGENFREYIIDTVDQEIDV